MFTAAPVTGPLDPGHRRERAGGAQDADALTPNNAQYRANVLQFLTDLSNLGATPLLSIANPPYTGGDAGYWWQQVSKVAILLRQVYFTSPNAVGLYKLTAGELPDAQSLRGLVDHLTQIGIPSGRVALEMQITTSPGLGQRAASAARARTEGARDDRCPGGAERPRARCDLPQLASLGGDDAALDRLLFERRGADGRADRSVAVRPLSSSRASRRVY